VCNFAFELIAPHVLYSGESYAYKACILRYLFAIALGMWVAKDPDLFSKRNKIVLLVAPFSVSYLVISDLLSYPSGAYLGIIPFFFPEWYTQNVLSFFYPTLLILLGIKYLPKMSTTRFISALRTAGKTSYEIFLIQIAYFGMLVIWFSIKDPPSLITFFFGIQTPPELSACFFHAIQHIILLNHWTCVSLYRKSIIQPF
jgi:hypothetical protein